MSKAKPIRVEAYKCPKCRAIIEGTYNQVQRHVDVPIDKPLPVGLAYSLCGRVYVIKGRGEISQEPSADPKIAHAYIQPIADYSPVAGDFSINVINSRVAREHFRKGKATFLFPNMFKIIREKFRGYTDSDAGKPLILKRTDKSLEQLANPDA